MDCFATEKSNILRERATAGTKEVVFGEEKDSEIND